MTNDTEEWRPVEGFPGYQVSSHGRVMTSRRWPNKPRLMKPLPAGRDRCGKKYLCVYLSRDGARGKNHIRLIHRLVMAAFVGPVPDGMQVNHKDGNPKNNHVQNLEYVTRSENMVHAFTSGLAVSPKGEANGSSKLTEEKIRAIRESNLTSRKAAVVFGVGKSAITSIRRRETWAHIE